MMATEWAESGGVGHTEEVNRHSHLTRMRHLAS